MRVIITPALAKWHAKRLREGKEREQRWELLRRQTKAAWHRLCEHQRKLRAADAAWQRLNAAVEPLDPDDDSPTARRRWDALERHEKKLFSADVTWRRLHEKHNELERAAKAAERAIADDDDEDEEGDE